MINIRKIAFKSPIEIRKRKSERNNIKDCPIDILIVNFARVKWKCNSLIKKNIINLLSIFWEILGLKLATFI